MKNIPSFMIFLVIVMGAGISIGTLTIPGDWYASLNKPFFNPPNWIFGPVWSVLYLFIAYVGWRVWLFDSTGVLLPLWILQMALNFLWSPVFFAAQKPAMALFVVLCLLLSIAAFIRAAWHIDRQSAVLFFPYAVWVGFASALNASIVYLN